MWGIVRRAAIALAAASLPAMADSCTWYSHEDSIRQVETSTNQVTRVVPLKHPHRLAMNAEDCSVWTLDKHDRRLLRFSAEGTLEKEIRVGELHPRLDEVDRLELDPHDGSLWVGDDRRLLHVSSAGALLTSFPAPGEVRRLQVALDQTLWALGKRELWRFDAQGTLLASYTLGRHLAGDARYFALDSLGGAVWLADDAELARLELADPSQPPLRVLPRHIAGLALDPFSGNVWVAQKEALLAFSRAGAFLYSVDLGALGLRKPEKLAFDPVSRSLWVGAEKSVSRFTDTGQLVAAFAARDGDEALGVPAFKVAPTLALIRPPQDALTNNPRPEFRLGYGAECNGTGCAFPGSYFSSYHLSATLNGEPVGSAFQFDASSIESSFTPSSRLPEGPNSFSAQAKDGFGHSSNTISLSFTIDTIAPRFLAISPDDGNVFQTPSAIIQGTIDDATATVVLESSGLSQTGVSFSFPVMLQPGANVFVLSAIDRAGNRTTAPRTLNYVPLAITITSPASGASVSGSTILVTGTVQGPPNTGVTVNGVVAAIAGGRFYATVPLQTGASTLTVIARTQDGFSAQQTVSVTSSGSSAIEVTATPHAGVAPLKVTFTVLTTTDVAIQGIDVDFDGDGTTDFSSTNPNASIQFTYTQPGIYEARFNVLRGDGTNTTRALSVVVQAIDQLDQQVRQIWNGMTAALVRGDKAAAMQYLNGRAKETYGPVFDALLPSMPQILGTFSDPQSTTIDAEVAEYAVNRVIDGVNRIFFIYFLRDIDGVWRLDSM